MARRPTSRRLSPRAAAAPAIFARRRAGVLLHVSSLPAPHGIGDLGPAAHAFADWCAGAGLTIWQMLPVGPVGPGDSPYASTSSFAGEPLFISLEVLAAEGLLSRADLRPGRGEPRVGASGPVDWSAVRRFKEPRLLRAYANARRARGGLPSSFRAFCRRHAAWLPGWCRFAAMRHGAAPDPEFHAWLQWQFDLQWTALRDHCSRLGVLLLGDVPIFVPLDSADVQDNPRLFRLDGRGRPDVVTGVPPDCFSATGQLWGHPHYRWSEHRRTGYAWWVARIRENLARFDALRVDHFVGFVHAYEIAGASRTAMRGSWRPTPRMRRTPALQTAQPPRSVHSETARPAWRSSSRARNSWERSLRACSNCSPPETAPNGSNGCAPRGRHPLRPRSAMRSSPTCGARSARANARASVVS